MSEVDAKVEEFIEELDNIRADFVHWCRVNDLEEEDLLVEALDAVFGASIKVLKK